MSKPQEGYANIDFSILTKENSMHNYISWKDSVGKTLHFNIGDINGELFIKEYFPQMANGIHAKLLITYLTQDYLVSVSSISNGYLPFINNQSVRNSNNLINWSFNIGQKIEHDDLDITITNRKYEGHEQFYQFTCNKCSFNSFDYYSKLEFHSEYWISAYNLRKLKHCPCCGVRATIVKPGINDIATVAPWLIDFFQGGIEEARKYSKGMKYQKGLICPDCGNILKDKNINRLYMRSVNPCFCQDSTSYPNRFLYNLLRQLTKHIDYWETEYSPEWISPKRYDGYVIIQNKEFIIELDGELGHGNVTFFREKDTNGKFIDNYKDEVAAKHDITVIRIPCLDISFDNLKQSFYNYLGNILPLQKVNWLLLKEQCFKNLYKEICLYYEKENKDLAYISKKYNISISRTKIILLQGREFGWCPSYFTHEEELQAKKDLALQLKLENENISSYDASKKCKLAPNVIVSIWKDNNLYDVNFEIRNRIKRTALTKNEKAQKIDTFLNGNKIIEAESIIDTIGIIKNSYDKDLNYAGIYKVINRYRNSYKGFVFRKINE